MTPTLGRGSVLEDHMAPRPRRVSPELIDRWERALETWSAPQAAFDTLRLAMGPVEVWVSGSVWQRALRLTAVVLLGAASYFAALWLVGVRPRDFVKRVT